MRLASAATVALVLVGGPAAGAVATAVLVVRTAGRLAAGPPDVAGTVLVGSAAALTLALAWLALACAAGAGHAFARLTGGDATSPRATRPAGVAAVVCSVVLAVAAPAVAAPGSTAQVGTGGAGWEVVVTTPSATEGPPVGAADPSSDTDGVGEPRTAGGWLPRISPVPPSATALVTPARTDGARTDGAGSDGARSDGATRVVHRGDSLWSLAAERLGSGATAGEIAAEWPRWWQANREVVGDDPDVLLPGQVLRVP